MADHLITNLQFPTIEDSGTFQFRQWYPEKMDKSVMKEDSILDGTIPVV